QRALVGRHKGLARHRQHGVENSDIGDVAGTHLAVDHFLARGRKTGHWRTLESCGRGPRGKQLETASSLVQTAPKRNADCAGKACNRLASRDASRLQALPA